MRHERRECLPRRHRHAADRQRRDEQQCDHGGQRAPDDSGACGAHAAHGRAPDARRIRLQGPAGRDGGVWRTIGVGIEERSVKHCAPRFPAGRASWSPCGLPVSAGIRAGGGPARLPAR
ncbi:hypothetical protein F01_260255 [Burkholderia cenocepacia]|nr:hypothetical protein F01_260255 [Burkholderia cenocepacia]